MMDLNAFLILIELGFNDTSTLVGHFVLSPREREKKDPRKFSRKQMFGDILSKFSYFIMKMYVEYTLELPQ